MNNSELNIPEDQGKGPSQWFKFMFQRLPDGTLTFTARAKVSVMTSVFIVAIFAAAYVMK